MHYQDRAYVILDRLEKEGLGLSRLLITLATGTVVLSITFLQFIGTIPDHQTTLITSWVSLTLSIVLGLTDRIVYIHGLSEHPLLTSTTTDDERIYQERRWNRYTNASEKISWLHVLTFSIGIISFLIFAIKSIS